MVIYIKISLHQETGYGGTTQKGHDKSKVGKMKAKKDRVLTVKFNADIAATMRWNFRPQQSEVKLFAGETALAFYTAKNPSTKPIDGISTYNVVPFEAGQVSYLCFFLVTVFRQLLSEDINFFAITKVQKFE